MADIISDGMTKIIWMTTCADASAPTVAELGAGTALESFVTPDGLDQSTEEARVDVSSIASTQDQEVAGRRKETVILTFKNQGDANAPYVTFADYPAGYIAIRQGVASTTAVAASQLFDVYTVKAGARQRIAPAPNEVLKFRVEFYSTAPLEYSAVVAA